jgi:hypothetical protein
MSFKRVRIIHNFGEKAKTTAAGAALMFAIGYAGECLHYHPEMQYVPTFVQSQWSAELPPHVPATAPNTAAVYVVLPPPQ